MNRKAHKYIKLFFVFNLLCFLISCSSYIEEENPSYKNGEKYKKYNYTFAFGRHKDKLLGYDIELYKNTDAWGLAKAVFEQDTIKISDICRKKRHLLFNKENKWGMTLLAWSVFNNRYFSAKILLENGADPNAKTNTGDTPFIDAASKETTNYLKLLLKHGGKVNHVIIIDTICCTPLKIAASTSFQNSKILIDAGADVNFSCDSINTAISYAAFSNKIETIEYLIEKNANYKNPIYKFDDKVFYLLDFVKNMEFENGSREQEIKKRVLKFLREHGADSSNYGEPILPK
ncbi:MAG: ankyrin repeat domain-containing protein [Taibaiella sp.]|nr:ankyrin repeat domain-containing protein [Taibaiella sp.]